MSSHRGQPVCPLFFFLCLSAFPLSVSLSVFLFVLLFSLPLCLCFSLCLSLPVCLPLSLLPTFPFPGYPISSSLSHSSSSLCPSFPLSLFPSFLLHNPVLFFLPLESLWLDFIFLQDLHMNSRMPTLPMGLLRMKTHVGNGFHENTTPSPNPQACTADQGGLD